MPIKIRLPPAETRRATAECQTGKAAADARSAAFWAEHELVLDKLCATRATTLEGLKVKARLAEMMQEDALAWSIVEDLVPSKDAA
jgi:hypothetical protein